MFRGLSLACAVINSPIAHTPPALQNGLYLYPEWLSFFKTDFGFFRHLTSVFDLRQKVSQAMNRFEVDFGGQKGPLSDFRGRKFMQM